MFATRSTALCAVLAPLFLHGVATAQPVLPTKSLSFDPLSSGLVVGGGSADGERVLTSAADYKNFTGKDAPASVHFGAKKGDDVVLAIRRNGWLVSSKIDVQKVTLGFEAGMIASVDFKTTGGPPIKGTLPPVGDVFVAVKVARPADGFSKFVFHDTTHPGEFKTLAVEITSKSPLSPSLSGVTRTFTVSKDGTTKLEHKGAGSSEDTLSIVELLDLQSKFRDAQVDTLPADVTQVMHVVAPMKTFSVKATFAGGSSAFSGEPGIYAASIAARVKPLMDLLFKLEQNAENKENEIDVSGRVGVSGGTVTISEESGVKPLKPLATWRVVNEPFFTMLKGLDGKRVHVHARRLPGIEPVINVLSVSGDNDAKVTVRNAQGKTIGSIAADEGVTVTGVKGLNYEIDFKGHTAYVKKSAITLGSTAIPLAVAPPSSTPGLVGGLHDHD